MRAVDTNLVVRYIVAHDDPSQSRKAKALIDGENVFVSMTVLLESEWVLRRVYKVKNDDMVAVLRGFAGLPTVSVDDASRLAQALMWMQNGLDFADALHLAGAQSCDEFATFDKALAKSAKEIAKPRVRLA